MRRERALKALMLPPIDRIISESIQRIPPDILVLEQEKREEACESWMHEAGYREEQPKVYRCLPTPGYPFHWYAYINTAYSTDLP